MQSIAAEVTGTAAKLRNLATSTWTGEAAARASARAASLPPKLDKVRVSYASAGAALARYAEALDDAQHQSTSARAAAQRANDDLNSARTAHEEAQSADARAAAAATASGQPTPAPAAPRYEAAITEAAARLKHAVEANADAHEAHDRAARVAAASLKEASREGIHNRPWWRHVASAACHWAATQWATALRTLSRLAATISALAGIAALALSIAGIFFPPLEIAAATLESISAATTVLATLAGTALAMTGKGSWLAVGIDALSFLPAGASKLVGNAAPRLRTLLRRGVKESEQSVGTARAAGSSAPGVRSMVGTTQVPITRTIDHALDKDHYLRDVTTRYGINLRGSGHKIEVRLDDGLAQGTYGATHFVDGGFIIRVSAEAIHAGDACTANTIAHELSHARYLLKHGTFDGEVHGAFDSSGDGTPYGSGNALQEWIEGKR